MKALVEAGASNYYQKVFRTLTNQLLIYANEHDTAYSRCINALAEYQRSENVTLYLVMDKRTYSFPDGFKESAEAYLSYREHIGIIKKSNKVFSLYLERFFVF